MKLFFSFCFLLLLQLNVASAEIIKGRAVIVDGDTINLGDVKVRLYGIDAPEAGQKCNKKNGGKWNCGKEAIRTLKRLISKNLVTCKGKKWDSFDRLIAVCHVGKIELNRRLVRVGLAWNFDKYSSTYKSLENRSRKLKLGVFQADTIKPWVYRKKRWEVAKQTSPEGCPIKGNISKRGKIYHTPWSPKYKNTRVSLDKNERWFCSEDEALKAGWRAPRWK